MMADDNSTYSPSSSLQIAAAKSAVDFSLRLKPFENNLALLLFSRSQNA
jgi:hypothetical protein